MKVKWVLSSMVMMLLAGCAMNRDLVMLNDKAERMERDLRQRQDMLQSKTDETSARQEDTFRTQHAEMRVNVERMRDELRAMTGRWEELEHIVRGRDATGGRSAGERTGRIDKMEEMLNANLQRITRLEDYVGLEPTRVASPAMDALAFAMDDFVTVVDDFSSTPATRGAEANRWRGGRAPHRHPKAMAVTATALRTAVGRWGRRPANKLMRKSIGPQPVARNPAPPCGLRRASP